MPTTLESSPHPLVFALGAPAMRPVPRPADDRVGIRTLARALDGMQKETIVATAVSGHAWRMASDEGPYLNGTDLAPFPLAFFTTARLSLGGRSVLLPDAE